MCSDEDADQYVVPTGFKSPGVSNGFRRMMVVEDDSAGSDWDEVTVRPNVDSCESANVAVGGKSGTARTGPEASGDG